MEHLNKEDYENIVRLNKQQEIYSRLKDLIDDDPLDTVTHMISLAIATMAKMRISS